MKTVVPFKNFIVHASVLLLSMAASTAVQADPVASATSGLVFQNPVLQSGTDLKKGAVYLFANVSTGVNALVSIDSLVNGATVTKIDDNSGGLGFKDAFQPEIQIGAKGESYVVFTIKLINATTGDPELLKTVQATALDIDGNSTLKEFADINMNGGAATYMGGTLEILLKNIPILNLLLNEYRADNLLGVEKTGIDTTAKGNMFTVTNSNISQFRIKYGAKSTATSNSTRQFSLYMKGFQYPNQIMLPLNLLSFTATLDKSTVNLKWTTAAEKNVSHFAIERSSDGKNFSDAATVFAFGNTTVDEDYSYADNTSRLTTGIVYYRLRCIDNDGKFTYSDIRVIKLDESVDAQQALAYPNPFVSELRITLPHNWQNKETRIELFNANGQLVKTRNIVSASQTETMNTSDLGRGFYVLRITNGAEKAQYKVIKS